MLESTKRPAAVWFATVIFLALTVVDLLGPLFLFGFPITTSVVQWIQYLLLLVGIAGFWRMRRWGPLLCALVLVASFVRPPIFQDSASQIFDHLLRAAVILIWLAPLALVVAVYRKRFIWGW